MRYYVYPRLKTVIKTFQKKVLHKSATNKYTTGMLHYHAALLIGFYKVKEKREDLRMTWERLELLIMKKSRYFTYNPTYNTTKPTYYRDSYL